MTDNEKVALNFEEILHGQEQHLTTDRAAMQSAHANPWRRADKAEYNSHKEIRTWTLELNIDYNEIFSSVIKMETAFLNALLEEEIYMAQPEWFKFPGKEHLVCKLLKSLYGSKQAPREWYKTFYAFLKSLGFYKLINDSCIFKHTVDGVTCYIAVYDLLIITLAPAFHKRADISPEKAVLHD
ncbi:Reverse transcriptase [Phytophthora palmivora]|uniref:Reverse transcriptase n=1 Tax=Phytophthora palmivora TaxID=4796 RepID=A0A2P4XW20_9STRA|nr:Reverse transcriptase [Phytophthora palmivora]